MQQRLRRSSIPLRIRGRIRGEEAAESEREGAAAEREGERGGQGRESQGLGFEWEEAAEPRGERSISHAEIPDAGWDRRRTQGWGTGCRAEAEPRAGGATGAQVFTY
jgi:hypothetical protein